MIMTSFPGVMVRKAYGLSQTLVHMAAVHQVQWCLEVGILSKETFISSVKLSTVLCDRH